MTITYQKFGYKKALLALIFLMALVSCKKTNESILKPDYFMSAQINGMNWKADKDYGVAQLEIYQNIKPHLWIRSQTWNPLINGVRYQIGMYIYNLVKGKYIFNNMVSGNIYGWKKNGTDDYFMGHSIDGFVEITYLTKDNIAGTFEFKAVTETTSSDPGNDTIVIKNGKFNVPIY